MLYAPLDRPLFTDEESNLILDLCFETCDYFSLSIVFSGATDHDLQKELSPYVCGELVTKEWFVYSSTPPLVVATYPIHPKTISIVKKYYSNIFICALNINHRLEQLLQDLCFFKEDSLVLGTVSHELICHVYPPNQDFEKRILNSYAHWKYSSDNWSQINLKDFGLSTTIDQNT